MDALRCPRTRLNKGISNVSANNNRPGTLGHASKKTTMAWMSAKTTGSTAGEAGTETDASTKASEAATLPRDDAETDIIVGTGHGHR